MALPKNSAQRLALRRKTQTKALKQSPLKSEAVTEGEKPQRSHYMPPTVESVEDDGEEMGGYDRRPSASISIIDGKTSRQLRAERRSAERKAAEKRDQDFTDDKKPMTKAEEGRDQGPPGDGITQDAGEEMDWDSNADAEGEVVEEERVASVKPENQEPPKETGPSLNAHAGGKQDKRNPFARVEVTSKSTPADGPIPDPPGADAGREVDKSVAAPRHLINDEMQNKAAARYFQLPKRQRYVIRTYYSPASSPSSSSEAAEEPPPQVNGTDIDILVGIGSSNIIDESSHLPSVEQDIDYEFYDRVSDGEGGDKNDENKIEDGQGAEREIDEDIVYPYLRQIDSPIGAHLQKIARAVNFMVRTRASGIEAGSFASLAAVSPEEWDQLVESPEYAAELMVNKLLAMTIPQIYVLSERATVLLNELAHLGITIEN